MKERFLLFIEKQALLQDGERILLAVSGGIDSVVLCNLLLEARIPFGIAHCNFGLRGKESEDDAAFVEALAKQWNVPFFLQSFQTRKFAKEHKLSVQMAARELRYQWFDSILKTAPFDYVATGHHLDDQVETFFINLLRGTGLGGLKGIAVRQGRIIRPMLFMTRDEIAAYAKEKNIVFREDSSNASQTYERNKIRQKLIPLLRQLQPGLSEIMADTFEKLKDAETILLSTVQASKEVFVKQKEDHFIIKLADLKKLNPVRTYLHYFLKDFGFTNTAVQNLAECLDQTETRVFYSENYCLTKDRNQVRIEPRNNNATEAKPAEYHILLPNGFLSAATAESNDIRLNEPFPMRLTMVHNNSDFLLSKENHIAHLNMEKIAWPLTIRPWQIGDQFRPLGMKGKKKVSDFFIDEKYAAEEKKACWMLCSGSQIAWLMGKRISEDFKIRPGTKTILKIELL